ncbi:hypothetical protein D3C86_2045040 [compost metagenome]
MYSEPQQLPASRSIRIRILLLKALRLQPKFYHLLLLPEPMRSGKLLLHPGRSTVPRGCSDPMDFQFATDRMHSPAHLLLYRKPIRG